MSPPALSVVVPLYNEEESLPLLAGEIAAALDPAGIDYELIFVDDGSTDGSPGALRRIAASDPRVRVLRLPERSGQSAALAAGFRHARGETVATLDADLQNDPADIPRLLAELDPPAGGAAAAWDVVCGVRIDRRDTWVRRVSSRIANGVRNWATDESIADVGCTLRVVRAELLRDLPMFTGMHRFLPTLLRLAGARVKEAPVRHRPRLYGEPKYGIRNRLFRGLADLVAVRWMQRRWIDPRRVEEITSWTTETCGSGSASPDRASSSAASSSSGSLRSGGSRA